jgi:signal transduction histidine kinase
MRPLLHLRRLIRQTYGRIPLSLRVALLVSPVIVISQYLTIRFLWENRPVSVLQSSSAFSPTHPAPSFMQQPGFPIPPHENPADRGPPAPWESPPLLHETLGQKLTFAVHHWIPPWQHLISIFCITAVIVWITCWWVMRPLQRLSQAAEALGRDVGGEPLDERGPPEVRRAANAFNRMQDRLLRFLRGRSDALLAMSHDLKTPITRLQLRLALLPEHLQAPIADDIGTLQKRVEEALTFMRGVHSGEPMQDVDVNALAAIIVERLQDTGADVTLNGTARKLHCRPGQLERSLANVLENAVRYGGSAQLDLIDRNDSLTLRVRDHGPGIPEALLPRVTEPFFRVESSRNRDSGGTGLGLAITKDLVESMGGRLDLSNLSRGGLEVAFTLPRQPR